MIVKFAFDLSRIWKHFGEGDFGLLSAYLGRLSPEENEARQAELKEQVRERGYGYKEVKGVWAGGHEYSLFVPGATREDVIWFGEEGWKPEAERMPQEAVIFVQGEGDAREVVLYDIKAGTPIETFVAMEVGLRDAWEGWTELRRHKFRFAPEKGGGKGREASSDVTSVTWHHYIPKDPPGGHLMAMGLGDWKNPKTCGSYIQDRIATKRKGVMDRVVIKKAKKETK